jgi:hypothetical protein
MMVALPAPSLNPEPYDPMNPTIRSLYLLFVPLHDPFA